MLALCLFGTLSCLGQGKWEKIFVKGDELAGTTDSEKFVFRDEPIGQMVLWGWDRYQFALVSDSCQFNTDVSGIEVLVGLYDKDGKMVEKFKLWLDSDHDYLLNRVVRTRNAGAMSNPVGQRGKVKKIFKVLRSGEGYVRFLCGRFNASDFDLKVLPCGL